MFCSIEIRMLANNNDESINFSLWTNPRRYYRNATETVSYFCTAIA